MGVKKLHTNEITTRKNMGMLVISYDLPTIKR
jgi:hypothetical protein